MTGWLLGVGERKVLLAVALSPTGKVLMVAGARHIPPVRVAIADVAGTFGQLGVLYATGRPVMHALEPSRGLMMALGVVALLAAVAGPLLAVRAVERRARGRSEPAWLA